MNIVARTLGGFFSDKAALRWGLNGRVRFLLSSAYPYQALFAHVTARLHPT